jgi:hypothetical protein
MSIVTSVRDMFESGKMICYIAKNEFTKVAYVKKIEICIRVLKITSVREIVDL